MVRNRDYHGSATPLAGPPPASLAKQLLDKPDAWLLRAPAGSATYFVPPEQLAQFVGARRLYYAVASYRTPEGGDPVLSMDRRSDVPSIRIGGDFTGRTLPANRSVARYGSAAVLAWGGDAALAFDTPLMFARGLDAVNAFGGRLSTAFVSDTRLQTTFTSAQGEALRLFPSFAARRVPMAIVALEPDGTNRLVGIGLDDMDFVGSQPKVGAMYAAFELRRAVREVAQASGKTGTELWQVLNAELDPQIRNAVARIPTDVPRYRDIFDLAATPIDFSRSFRTKLEGMMRIGGDNRKAAECIEALGLQYINGALARAGLFGPRGGIWLSGNYTTVLHRLANTLNDGDVAQAGTPRSFALLFTALARRSVIDGTTSDEMLALLDPSHPDVSFVSPHVAGPTNHRSDPADSTSFTVKANKGGTAHLGRIPNQGPEVSSAVSIVEDPSGRRFVIAWQNMADSLDEGFRPIARIAQRTVSGYLQSPP